MNGNISPFFRHTRTVRRISARIRRPRPDHFQQIKAAYIEDAARQRQTRRTHIHEQYPPAICKTPRLEEAVPILYLRGLSTGNFQGALSALLGEEAIAGFSSATVTRLLSVWQDEYKAWRKRPLTNSPYTYIWADGIHFNIRLEEDRLASLDLAIHNI